MRPAPYWPLDRSIYVAMMYEQPVTDCAWCGAQLNAGEIFNYELKYEGWKAGGLLAPENPEFESDCEPLPSCTKCLQSINEQYDSILADRLAESQHRKTARGKLQRLAIVALCAGPLIAFPVAIAYTLVLWLIDLLG